MQNPSTVNVAFRKNDLFVNILLFVLDHNLRKNVIEPIYGDWAALPEWPNNVIRPRASIAEGLVSKECQQSEQMLQLRVQKKTWGRKAVMNQILITTTVGWGTRSRCSGAGPAPFSQERGSDSRLVALLFTHDVSFINNEA